MIREDPLHKLLFLGEFFWNISIRKDLRKELPYLKKVSEENRELWKEGNGKAPFFM